MWLLERGPWLDTWWCFLLDLMRRLSLLRTVSLHPDILRDDVADARASLPFAAWAQGIEMQFTTVCTLGMASFISSVMGVLDSLFGYVKKRQG